MAYVWKGKPEVAHAAPVPPAKREPAPCGTYPAYSRHRRNDETPCEPCREANAVYTAAHRRKTPAKPRELTPCGSVAAYRRHMRTDRDPCGPCKAANKARRDAWRARKAMEAAA